MFNLFKREAKKIYCVTFSDGYCPTHVSKYGMIYNDLVRAKDPAQAWCKVVKKHPFAAKYCISAKEVNQADKESE